MVARPGAGGARHVRLDRPRVGEHEATAALRSLTHLRPLADPQIGRELRDVAALAIAQIEPPMMRTIRKPAKNRFRAFFVQWLIDWTWTAYGAFDQFLRREVAVERSRAELLRERGDAGGLALLDDRADPRHFAGTRTVPALSTNNQPVEPDIILTMQRLPDDWRRAVVTAYVGGATINAIATAHGGGIASVWRTLREAGVTVRRQGSALMPLTVRMPDEPTAVGYLAGLFDGEGNLYWRRRSARASSIRLTIYSTTPEVMAWLERIGGKVRWDDKRVDRKGWKRIARWEVSRSRDVAAILSAIAPLLIIKREIAAEALADLQRTAAQVAA